MLIPQRFHLFGYIDAEAAATFIHSMWQQDNADSSLPWEVILNTEGGDMDAGTAVYSELCSYSKRSGGEHHVTVRVRGQAASCGSLILQAGDHRTARHMDYIMLHEPLMTFEDATLQRVRDELSQAESWSHNFTKILQERGNRSQSWFTDKIAFSRDWWVSAEEALEYGLIDEIA